MFLSKGSYLLIGASLLLSVLAAFAVTAELRPSPVILAPDTAIEVSLDQAVASDQSRPGDRFQATVSAPIAIEGKTVIPKGAHVDGLVVDAHRSGRLKGQARLDLELKDVQVNGKTYEIHTIANDRVGGRHKNRNIGLIGGGAGGGALIGAVAAGGKGALIGAPIGAGAGTAVAYFTGKKDIRLPAESKLTFRLAQPVIINVKAQVAVRGSGIFPTQPCFL